MTQSSQQYANLSDDAYENRWIGVRTPQNQDYYEKDGVIYAILEHYRNPRTGYAGTIYRDVDTGDIVVAHRGTEVKNIPGLAMDLAYTDGSMVLARVNPQAEDAIQLAKRAVEFAEAQGKIPGRHAPQVTVTGHSLGGCHAQITAHHFGLRGETFNAYGAASLGLRIPEGGDKVLNHVMAADVVNAASPHYGQVRIYASRGEIEMLDRIGYDNDRDRFDVRMRGAQPIATIGSHFMSHFTDDDGPKGKDRSILSDPDALARAHRYAPMIERARDDMREQRSDLTDLAKAASLLSGQGFPRHEAPLEPGEPALRAGHVKERVVIPPLPEGLREGRPVPTPAPRQQDAPTDAVERVTIPPVPEYMRRMAEPQASAEPAQRRPQDASNGLSPQDRQHYDQAFSLGQRLGLSQEQAENLGMATAAKIKENLSIREVDRMIVVQGRGENGSDRVFASYHPYGDREPIFNTFIDVDRAAKTPAAESARSIDVIALAQDRERAQTPTPSPDDPAPKGPRIG